jgi:hypothetical protein
MPGLHGGTSSVIATRYFVSYLLIVSVEILGVMIDEALSVKTKK